MALDLQTDALVDTVALPAAAENPPHTLRADATGHIPTSQEITGLEVRLSRVLVKDNRTPKVWPFPGRASVYVLLLVLDNLSSEPNTLTLNGFADIDDNEDLPVDKTAYLWQPAPERPAAPAQVHVLLSILKSKKRLRDTGQALAAAQADPRYRAVLGQLLGAAGAPGAAAEVALQLGGLVGGFLENVDDRPLFTQFISFTGINGNFDALGKTVHAAENDFVRTELTLVVRDVSREPAVG